ncbi:hypothetical protein AB0N23_34510, partial [Streptomyces sp. NPDC052644]
EQDRPPRRTAANWVLAGLISAFGMVVFVATVLDGRADGALLFVLLPTALAATLALLPGRTAHGRVFVVTTIALLLAAVALHEGAVCVVFAAPLVYAVSHGTTALIRALRDASRPYAVIAVPLLLLPGLEGSGPAPRLAPDQSVEVVRVVALPADQVAARLAAGPRPVPVRSVPLRLLGVPTPGQVSGDGLDPGDRWMFGYHGSAHGPGGHLLAEVETVGVQRGQLDHRALVPLAARHAELAGRRRAAHRGTHPGGLHPGARPLLVLRADPAGTARRGDGTPAGHDGAAMIAARYLSLAVPLLAVLAAARVDRSRAGRAAALLAFLAAGIGIAALDEVARRTGWYTFTPVRGSYRGMPVDLWIGWAVLWGPLPVLLRRTLPLPVALGLLLWVDAVAMPALHPLVRLGPDWLVGELVGLLVVALPTQLLGRWCADRRHLAARALLQVGVFTALLLWLV